MVPPAPSSIPFVLDRFPPDRMVAEGGRWFEHMARRRSVRDFDPEPPPRACVELAVRTAATAPSDGHRQPWRFVVVDDPELKHEIRLAVDRARAEGEERPGTDPLETAPYVVVAFRETGDGRRHTDECMGLACGLFIAALHWMRLVTVPFAPPPAGGLGRILGRPANEEPYLLFPVGYAAPDALVPDLVRKRVGEILQWNRG